MDVHAQKGQCHQPETPAVEQADTHLLAQQRQLLLQTEVFVHQHPDGHCQRLGTHVSRHVQHQRLEADDDGQHRHHRFKDAHHRGYAHAQKQQHDQPRQALFHADEHRLAEILLRGQTAQLGVVVAHGVVHQLHQILRRQDADDAAGLRQHRQGVLLVLRQPVDAVRYLLMGEYIGIPPADHILQAVVFPGNDQILQVDGAGKGVAFVHHVQGGDVVVFPGLPHQLAHGAADGQRVRDAHEIAAHPAADLLLPEGQQPPDIRPDVRGQMRRQTLPLLLRQLLQNVQRVCGVHAGEHLRRPRLRQSGETAGGIVQIGEYRCQRRYIHQTEHPLPLGLR